jgi:hypothetical protein
VEWIRVARDDSMPGFCEYGNKTSSYITGSYLRA